MDARIRCAGLDVVDAVKEVGHRGQQEKRNASDTWHGTTPP